MLKLPLVVPLPKMVSVPPEFIVKLPPVPFKKTAVPPGIVGWLKFMGPVGVPIVTAEVVTGGPAGIQLAGVAQRLLVALPVQVMGSA
jgi:hypothetical protein